MRQCRPLPFKTEGSCRCESCRAYQWAFGGIGLHTSLRSWRRKACAFESRKAHQVFAVVMQLVDISVSEAGSWRSESSRPHQNLRSASSTVESPAYTRKTRVQLLRGAPCTRDATGRHPRLRIGVLEVQILSRTPKFIGLWGNW